MSIRYYALKLGLYFVYSGNIVVPFVKGIDPEIISKFNSASAIYNLFPREQTLLHYEIRFANPEIKRALSESATQRFHASHGFRNRILNRVISRYRIFPMQNVSGNVTHKGREDCIIAGTVRNNNNGGEST